MTEVLALELEVHNIQVNALGPGSIHTRMWEELRDGAELASATECFVTSATREVMPVLSIRVDDGHMVEFPEGGGELTRQVLSYYRMHVDKYLQEHAHFSLF